MVPLLIAVPTVYQLCSFFPRPLLYTHQRHSDRPYLQLLNTRNDLFWCTINIIVIPYSRTGTSKQAPRCASALCCTRYCPRCCVVVFMLGSLFCGVSVFKQCSSKHMIIVLASVNIFLWCFFGMGGCIRTGGAGRGGGGGCEQRP